MNTEMKSELIVKSNPETVTDIDLQSENDKHLAILGNLRNAFNLSEEELTDLLSEEHYYHQY